MTPTPTIRCAGMVRGGESEQEAKYVPRVDDLKEAKVLQLKLTLKWSKPPIWRRVQVKDNLRLGDLHAVIQAAMGWGDCHLHQFSIQGRNFGVPSDEDWEDVADEDKVRLAGLGLGPKRRFTYEYDFGDGWQHEILVEKVLPSEDGVKYPRCSAGKMACPPEDCGGIYGYYNMLAVVADPAHPDHADLRDWLGDSFKPDEFDLAVADRRVQSTLQGPRTWRRMV